MRGHFLRGDHVTDDKTNQHEKKCRTPSKFKKDNFRIVQIGVDEKKSSLPEHSRNRRCQRWWLPSTIRPGLRESSLPSRGTRRRFRRPRPPPPPGPTPGS